MIPRAFFGPWNLIISGNFLKESDEMIVMKFGGESLKNGQSIIYISDIVRQFKNKAVIVVVSALYNVSELLISICKNCQRGELKKAEKGIKRGGD